MKLRPQSRTAAWPSQSANELAAMVHDSDDGFEEALALAFSPPLGFDPNAKITIARASNEAWRTCDDLLSVLLIRKPAHYDTYAHALLDGGFSFAGRDHYRIARLLIRGADDALIDKAVAHGLNLHAIKSENEPHNVLLDAVHSEDPELLKAMLARCIDPFMMHRFREAAGHMVERSLFAEALQFCRRGYENNPDNYIGTPMTLLKLGLAKVDSMNESFIYFDDCHGHMSHLYCSIPHHNPGMPPIDRSWEQDRFRAFESYLRESKDLAFVYLSGEKKIRDISTEDFLRCYTANQLENICSEGWWKGSEGRLFEIYTQMPAHIQWEMEDRVRPLLVAGAIHSASHIIQLPAQHWTMQTNPEMTRS